MQTKMEFVIVLTLALILVGITLSACNGTSTMRERDQKIYQILSKEPEPDPQPDTTLYVFKGDKVVVTRIRTSNKEALFLNYHMAIIRQKKETKEMTVK